MLCGIGVKVERDSLQLLILCLLKQTWGVKMRIIRNSDFQCNIKKYDCQLYVRNDLTVAKATEWYYMFMGPNSYLPVNELLYPEDGELLKRKAMDLTETVELITGITNFRKPGYCTVYLRMEKSNHTENGQPLLLIKFYDFMDMENRNLFLEKNIAKYRRFMSLDDEYYFEYIVNSGKFEIYKYVNDKAMHIFNSTLELYQKERVERAGENQKYINQLNIFCGYLQNGTYAFETELPKLSLEEGKLKIKGGVMFKDSNLIVGIMSPNWMAEEETYYLSSAAQDPGTGLLNKKAIAEYVMERFMLQDNKIRWLIMMDVDNFKEINDRYGHLFGDDVIHRVAETLRNTIGYRGVIGRFGGDEFFVLLEEVETRDELKYILKTIVKQLYYCYDPICKITCSFGISQYPKDGMDYTELLGKADKALYIAKEKGKDRHVIYDDAIHGSYVLHNAHLNTVAFSVSKEKRTQAIVDIMKNLYAQGIDYIEQEHVQNLLREVFDLDGISMFDDYGKRVVCRSGEYTVDAPDASIGLKDKDFISMFNENGVMIESNMLRLKNVSPRAYEVALKQDTGATILCIGWKDTSPYSMITFDVFHRNRKWSDQDAELLSLIGCCMNQVLCMQ